jgi:hypothetical protein
MAASLSCCSSHRLHACMLHGGHIMSVTTVGIVGMAHAQLTVYGLCTGTFRADKNVIGRKSRMRAFRFAAGKVLASMCRRTRCSKEAS